MIKTASDVLNTLRTLAYVNEIDQAVVEQRLAAGDEGSFVCSPKFMQLWDELKAVGFTGHELNMYLGNVDE